MPGPVPQPTRRRTNAPTIPTTNLPPAGRSGPVPKLPAWVTLEAAGSAWWKWAWKSPQAAAWNAGHEPFVARRAMLEDDLATVGEVEGLDCVTAMDHEEFAPFKRMVARLASLASGRLQIFKEMRELDDRLGLTPKSMAALRWTIAEEEPAKPAATGVVVNVDRWQRGA